jgi:hypothetical protein
LTPNEESGRVSDTEEASGVADPATVSCQGVELEVVKEFCYLGSMITESCSISCEIDVRLRAAYGRLALLRPVLRSDRISKRHKTMISLCVVVPTLFYGAETWTTTSREEDRLDAFLNKVRLAILGLG